MFKGKTSKANRTTEDPTIYIRRETTEAKPHTKTNNSKNHYLIYGICGAISILAIAVIIWVLLTTLNKPVINEEYFVSDDTKTTISLPSTESGEATHRTYTVYEYDGENVSGMKTYFEYDDAEAASAAYESVKSLPEFEGAELQDKYIIVTADQKQYQGLTASDIRQQAEAIERFQNEKNNQQ